MQNKAFQLYGTIGTVEARGQLSEAIANSLKTSGELAIFPKDTDMTHYTAAIQKMVSDTKILSFSQKFPALVSEIHTSILDWLKKVQKNVLRNYPETLEKEEHLYEAAVNSDTIRFFTNFPIVKEALNSVYKKGEIDFSFYEKKINEISAIPKGEKALKNKFHEVSKGLIPKNITIKEILQNPLFQEFVKTIGIKEGNVEVFYKKIETQINTESKSLQQVFLKDWATLLFKKKLDYELAEIDKARAVFLKELYDKMADFEKMKDLLSAFTDDLGRLWDLSGGVWKNTGFEILKQYAELLKKDTLLQELAEMLGRMRKAEKEYEEELYAEMVLTPAFKIDYAHKSEYIGIHESADLSSVLPSELALLSDATTELLFYKKMAEKKLMTWEYQTQFLSAKEIEQENIRQKAKETDKGPIIICVDTSGSMHGTPEYVAKVLCFSMVKIALNDNRKCYLISFSTKIETLELTDLGQSLEKLIAFLQMSFHGGTDATPALHEANKMLQTSNYQKADVLMISDFIMNGLASSVTSAMQIQKENGTKFHSLSICSEANSNIINAFDNNWIYDTNDTQSLKRLVTNFRSL